MKMTFKILTLVFVTLVFGTVVAARAQVAPEATGPRNLLPSNKLEYAVRYAETGELSNSLGNFQLGTASGSLTYASGKERTPFTVDYSGGYTFGISGPSFGTGAFQHLFLSQGINGRKWQALVSDDVSYLPEAPTTGFSGIPGIGEPIGVTTPTPTTSETILTLNTHVLDNSASGSLDYSMSPASHLAFGGTYELLRFPDGNGLDTNTETGYAQFAGNLNSRTAILGRYAYTEFTYPAYSVSLNTNSAQIGVGYKWSRHLASNVSVGPEWLGSSIPATFAVTVAPSSTSVAVDASAEYKLGFTTYSVTYTRGINGGAGYLVGGQSDAVAGNFSREYGTNLTVGLTGGYARTAGLLSAGQADSVFGGTQATWAFGRNLIVFANYTGIDQSASATLPTNVLGQLVNIIGFGIGYSPRTPRIKQ
jgi:hypothetical protein